MWNMDGLHVRNRVTLSSTSQERIAREAGYEPSVFSRILRGLRPEPPDFEPRVTAALDRLERAEKAAQEARQRVLGGAA